MPDKSSTFRRLDTVLATKLVSSTSEWLAVVKPTDGNRADPNYRFELYALSDFGCNNQTPQPKTHWNINSIPFEVKSISLHVNGRYLLLVGLHAFAYVTFTLDGTMQPKLYKFIRGSNTESGGEQPEIVRARWHVYGETIVVLYKDGTLWQKDLSNNILGTLSRSTRNSQIERDFSSNDDADNDSKPITIVKLVNRVQSALMDPEESTFVDFAFGGNGGDIWDPFCCYCVTLSGTVYVTTPIIPARFTLSRPEAVTWANVIDSEEVNLEIFDVFTLQSFRNQIEEFLSSVASSPNLVINRPAGCESVTRLYYIFYLELTQNDTPSLAESLLILYSGKEEQPLPQLILTDSEGGLYIYELAKGANTRDHLDDEVKSPVKTFGNMSNTRSKTLLTPNLGDFGILFATKDSVYSLRYEDIINRAGGETAPDAPSLIKPTLLCTLQDDIAGIEMLYSIYFPMSLIVNYNETSEAVELKLTNPKSPNTPVLNLFNNRVYRVPASITENVNAATPNYIDISGISQEVLDQRITNVDEEGIKALKEASQQVKAQILSLMTMRSSLVEKKCEQIQTIIRMQAFVRESYNATEQLTEEFARFELDQERPVADIGGLETLLRDANTLIRETGILANGGKSKNRISDYENQISVLEQLYNQVVDLYGANQNVKITYRGRYINIVDERTKLLIMETQQLVNNNSNLLTEIRKHIGIEEFI